MLTLLSSRKRRFDTPNTGVKRSILLVRLLVSVICHRQTSTKLLNNRLGNKFSEDIIFLQEIEC